MGWFWLVRYRHFFGYVSFVALQASWAFHFCLNTKTKQKSQGLVNNLLNLYFSTRKIERLTCGSDSSNFITYLKWFEKNI
jgi:hypothetical protein